MSRSMPWLATLVVLVSAGLARTGPSVEQLRQAGDLEGAVLRARQIVDENPEDLTAHVVYQDLQLTLGHAREVRKHYRDRARAEDATADGLYLYGRLLEGAAAERQYRAALKKDPRHFETLCALGSLLTEMGKVGAARELLERARTSNSDSGVPVNALGWLEERQGNAARAEALYREAIDLQPRLVVARVNLGLLLVGLGRLEHAVITLEQAVDLAPADATPLLALGTAHLASGSAEDAVRAFESAIELGSHTVTSLNLLANAYRNLGQHELAEKALLRAREMEPEDATTCVNLAFLQLARGELETAASTAQEALRLNDDLAQAWYVLGAVAERQGSPRKAEAAYRRASKGDPENPSYHRALRALHASLGRWKSAIDSAEEAAELSGNSPDTLYELAMAYLGGSRAEKAADTLDRVVAADPGRLDAWLNLGVVSQEKLRDPDRAAKAYREYVRRGGKDPRVSTWLAEIEKR